MTYDSSPTGLHIGSVSGRAMDCCGMVSKYLVIAAAVVLAACDNAITDMTNREEQKAPMFAVRVDPSYAAQMTPDQARADEQQAIEALVARLPADQQSNARRILSIPSTLPMRAADAEAARLLGVIASIRAARSARAAQTVAGEGGAAVTRRTTPGLVVQVALTRVLPVARARAVVIRDRDDNGIPLLLLSESDATVEDLTSGLQVAIEQQDRLGAKVGTRMTTPVQGEAPPASRQTDNIRQFSHLLAHLRTVPTRSIAGVGQVRSVGIKVPYPAR